MKKLIATVSLIIPAVSMAAPAITGNIVVQDNTAQLTAQVKGKAVLSGLNLDGVPNGNDASLNANSIKVRGGSIDGDVLMKNNSSGISAAVGGSGNVNSVEVSTF